MEAFEITDEFENYFYRCQEWPKEEEEESLQNLIREGFMYIKGTTEYNGEQWTLFDKIDAINNFYMMRTKELYKILGETYETYEIY